MKKRNNTPTAMRRRLRARNHTIHTFSELKNQLRSAEDRAHYAECGRNMYKYYYDNLKTKCDELREMRDFLVKTLQNVNDIAMGYSKEIERLKTM